MADVGLVEHLEGRMDVCFVAYTRDSAISRAYEHFDTGQIEKFLGPGTTG